MINHWFDFNVSSNSSKLTSVIRLHTLKWLYMKVISFLKELELFLHSRMAIVSTQLNGFKYFYINLIILFTIKHLFAERVTGIAI